MEDSPYRAPQVVDDPPPEDITVPPPAIRIFGTLHRLFGFLSLISLAIGIGEIVAVKFSPEDAIRRIFIPLGDTLLLLIAGNVLLKKKKSGRKWSNGYAWFSIITSLWAWAAEGIVYFYSSAERTPSPMTGDLEILQYIGQILLSIAYPVLSLIFLNRPRVKAWASAQPV